MKKIIGIIITLIIMLTGCSSTKKGVDNKNTQSINNTTSSNASSSNNQQLQLQSENTSQNSKSTNGNISSSLPDDIDTSKSPFEKGYYDYQGTIGNNMSIQMSIYPLGTDIVGTYFYNNQRKEIKLQGKVGEKNIILYEFDETGKNTGIFQGTISTVDKIEGTWTSVDGKMNYPFTLSLKSNIPGVEYGKRYAVPIGTETDQDVEDFVSKIQSYVINDDKENLSLEIQYPINVKINDKVTKIQNKDDFIKNYDQIFYPAYKQIISNAYTKYLFANWKGIMFGENLYNIWINESNSKLMITAINN